jgi:hypothetical protein
MSTYPRPLPPANRRESPAEDRLTALLCLASPIDAEKEAIRALISMGSGHTLDWQRFWQTVTHNDVGPLVSANLRWLGHWSSLPGWLQQKLQARADEIAAANARRRDGAGRFFTACTRDGVPVIVLKGMLFAETIYRNPGYKRMNDLDLLVRFADIDRVKAIYSELGLFPLELLEGGDDAPRRDKTHHLPAYVSDDLGFIVGTHWDLASPKRGFKTDIDGLWSRAQPTTVAGHLVHALSPEDNFHHLCIHFHYYKTGLKELADFVNLARGTPHFDWDLVHQRLDSAGTWGTAARPLPIVEALYPGTIPEQILEACRRHGDPGVVADTAYLVARADLLLRSRSTYESQIEKAYLQFSFAADRRDKLRWFGRFWQRLVLPPHEVVERTNAVGRGEVARWRLYWWNLRRTAAFVGRDYGLAIFFLLMGKSFFELFLALLPGFTSPGLAIRQRLAERLGHDEKKIQHLLAAME